MLILSDEQRSSLMTNGHLPPVGNTSVLHPRLVYPCSVARNAGYIPILWEFRFLHLAVCLLRGIRLSFLQGSLSSLYLNSLGFPIPILSKAPKCSLQLFLQSRDLPVMIVCGIYVFDSPLLRGKALMNITNYLTRYIVIRLVNPGKGRLV